MENVQNYLEFGLLVVGAASTVAAGISKAFNTDKGTKVAKLLGKLEKLAQLVGLHKPSVTKAVKLANDGSPAKVVDHRD